MSVLDILPVDSCKGLCGATHKFNAVNYCFYSLESYFFLILEDTHIFTFPGVGLL